MNLPLQNASSERLDTLITWLQSLPFSSEPQLDTLQPASSDASFRRYFRLRRGDAGSCIVMDAPPGHEDCRPFVHVTGLLRDAGLAVPDVLAAQLDDGFLLLSDLGTQTYYDALQTGLDDAAQQRLYRPALAALVQLQGAVATGLPAYDRDRLTQELTVFPEWYIEQHCGVSLNDGQRQAFDTVCTLLVEDAVKQPQVLVHRDFHSPNLMVPLPGTDAPGILDYQDALRGPLTYDIASLAFDARYSWEEEQQLDWAIRYWEMARKAGLPVATDFAEFHRAYEWMGLQRNLRILGVFARLHLRDGKPQYLAHLPRVLGYASQVAERYQPLRPIARLLEQLPEPAGMGRS